MKLQLWDGVNTGDDFYTFISEDDDKVVINELVNNHRLSFDDDFGFTASNISNEFTFEYNAEENKTYASINTENHTIENLISVQGNAYFHLMFLGITGWSFRCYY